MNLFPPFSLFPFTFNLIVPLRGIQTRMEDWMKVQVKKGDPATFRCEAIVVCHFEDSKKLAGAADRLDRCSEGLLGEVIKSGDFTGKQAQVSVIYTRGTLPARRGWCFSALERRRSSTRSSFEKPFQKPPGRSANWELAICRRPDVGGGS